MTEDLEDIRALDAATAKPARRMIPFEVTSAILDGVSPIRAWREHRNLSLQALAAAAAVDVSRLTELESGARKATRAELRKLARALGAQIDDLCDPPAL
jgi:ribosome-binding protein aMBF1 (putative translation factor)